MLSKARIRMIMVCVVAFTLGCSGLPKNAMTIAQAYTRVQKAAPPGTPRAKAEKWANSKGYRVSYIASFQKDPGVIALNVDPKEVSGVLEIMIDDTIRSLHGSSPIRVLLVLDNEEKVIQQSVKLESSE